MFKNFAPNFQKERIQQLALWTVWCVLFTCGRLILLDDRTDRIFVVASRSFEIFKLDENLHVVLNIVHVKNLLSNIVYSDFY